MENPDRFSVDIAYDEFVFLAQRAMASMQIKVFYPNELVKEGQRSLSYKVSLPKLPGDDFILTFSGLKEQTVIESEFVIPLKHTLSDPPEGENPRTIRIQYDPEDITRRYDALHEFFQILFNEYLDIFAQISTPQSAEAIGGRPRLNRSEKVARLVMALKAEDIRRVDPNITWKEVVRKIGWNFGDTIDSKIKLLQQAVEELKKLREDDPEGLLEDALQMLG